MNAAQVAALFTSANERWGTPGYFYAWLDAQFRFNRDVCADATNYKHTRYWNRQDNALVKDWSRETWFGNYPYGRNVIEHWTQKGRNSALVGGAGVQLVPARVDAKWWRETVLSKDGRAGHLVGSRYVSASDVLWLFFEGLTTGIYFVPHRLDFDIPADAGPDVGDGESAPFPSALVIQLSLKWRAPTQRPELLGGYRKVLRGEPPALLDSYLR